MVRCSKYGIRRISQARHLVSRNPKAGTQLILLRRRASAGARRAFIDGVPWAADLSRGTETSFWTIWRLCFQGAFFRARDPTRRLSGALAARRAASDRFWIVIAACKERRMLGVTLRHHGAILNLAAAGPRADITQVPE